MIIQEMKRYCAVQALTCVMEDEFEDAVDFLIEQTVPTAKFTPYNIDTEKLENLIEECKDDTDIGANTNYSDLDNHALAAEIIDIYVRMVKAVLRFSKNTQCIDE